MTAEEIHKYFDHFTSIYDDKGEEVNPLPEGVKLTVYCEGKGFGNRGYAVTRLKLIDAFPNTHHFEVIASLERA